MQDKQGREYAKLSQLKPGDCLQADSGFECMSPRELFEVKQHDCGELYINCRDGKHFLVGQTDNNEDIIGLYYCPPHVRHTKHTNT